MALSEKNVLDALSRVIEPELHKDLVTLNMIKDLKLNNNDVAFSIELTTPGCPRGVEQAARHWQGEH